MTADNSETSEYSISSPSRMHDKPTARLTSSTHGNGVVLWTSFIHLHSMSLRPFIHNPQLSRTMALFGINLSIVCHNAINRPRATVARRPHPLLKYIPIPKAAVLYDTRWISPSNLCSSIDISPQLSANLRPFIFVNGSYHWLNRFLRGKANRLDNAPGTQEPISPNFFVPHLYEERNSFLSEAEMALQ